MPPVSGIVHLKSPRSLTVSASHYPPAHERMVAVTATKAQRWHRVVEVDEYVYGFRPAVFRVFKLTQIDPYVFGAFSYKAALDPRLAPLENLKGNWDGYGSEAPGPVALHNAEQTLLQIDGYPMVPTRIVPSAEGGISIVFGTPTRLATLEFLNTGEILISLVGARAEPEVSEVTLPFIAGALDRICAHTG